MRETHIFSLAHPMHSRDVQLQRDTEAGRRNPARLLVSETEDSAEERSPCPPVSCEVASQGVFEEAWILNQLSRLLAEVGAEREGARAASGTVTPAKHPASAEPRQAGAQPPGPPWQPPFAGGKHGERGRAKRRARNAFLRISGNRQQVRGKRKKHLTESKQKKL